ncbi:hypothetical protein BKX93_10610 [Chromobacterium vaccinii]|uniref:Uncharacterized protein n=1 Tax=Chromobacterium vaccinii TaxID=1108595 RepID=A0A1D9LGJ8_9NEIS|nr:hypothetical protein BKX93_10610 [Chromobacterium vaccinii]
MIDVLNTIAEQNGSANAIHAVLLTKVDKNCLPTKDSSRSMPRYVCINQLMDAMKSGLSHDLNLTYTSNALADEATLTNYMLLIDHEHLAMRKATQEHKQCHKQAAVCDAARDYALAQAQDRLDELQTKIEKINPPTLKQYSIVQNQISKDIPQTIQKLEEAHTKLIDTWDKPDRKAEAKAAFMSVKALATSIADVAQLLK